MLTVLLVCELQVGRDVENIKKALFSNVKVLIYS